MSVCWHFSQRATCPPRAAVRQLSMADMTFNWPRLTWPVLAQRQAGPWARKISATSIDGRGKRRRVLRRRPHPCDEMFERAGDLAERLEGDARIGSVEIHRELMTAAARWIMAWKLWSVLSARMAIRLNSLSLQKKFSMR